MMLLCLCKKQNCRKIKGHKGKCDERPSSIFSFLNQNDQNKLSKAGYSTPRGGDKGGYQNHVTRPNKVIIPYEKIKDIPEDTFNKFTDGFVIRLFPHQYFNEDNTIKSLDKLPNGREIKIEKNSFILYRSRDCLIKHPPLPNWEPRNVVDSNGKLLTSRNNECKDTGHYLIRIPALTGGNKSKKTSSNKLIKEGIVQGIFAPEYANEETNYLCKILLAWQIVNTVDSPYLTSQIEHLKLIVNDINHDIESYYEYKGIFKGEFLTCPLCLKKINYSEFHEVLCMQGEEGLENAGEQISNTTRSREINLFHMIPLNYKELNHSPQLVSWGHANCNTRLGQRRCWSVNELKKMNNKIAKINGENIHSFAWMSDDEKMIRSVNGAVWIKISNDTNPITDYV